MKDFFFTIGFLLLGNLLITGHAMTVPLSIEKKPTNTITTLDVCVLLPEYTITLTELENGRYVFRISVTNMGRADNLRISFFYTDLGINEELTTVGEYEVGIIGFDQPRQNGFFAQDNVHITIVENSSLCGIQNNVVFNKTILPESIDPTEDNCALKFIGSNEDNSCFYQEEHWLRTNTSSGLPACGNATTPNDLWLKVPISAAGETEISITDPLSNQPLIVNYEVYKGVNCVEHTAILTCQTGSEIAVGPYHVGEFLFFRIWLDDLTEDRLIRICTKGTICNLPTYSINTQKDCTNKTIDKMLSISDLGDAASLDIYLNNELIHDNVTTGDYAIPTFSSCSDALLKIEATNTFCGVTKDVTDVCMEEKTCATAIVLPHQQTSNFTYTPATTCGREAGLPECGGFSFYPVEWFMFTPLSSNVNLWLDANFGMEVNLYTGDCSNNLQFNTCYQQQKGERSKALNLMEGETYYVAIFNTNFSRSKGAAAAFQIAVQSDNALALVWTDFNGVAHPTGNLLQWTVNHHQQGATFLLERSTTGTGDWEQVNMLETSKDVVISQSYSLLDQHPYEKTFYRLQFTNADGQQQVSKVIQVERQQSSVTVQQVGAQIFIKNIQTSHTPLYLQIINTQGQLLLKRSLLNKEMNLSINEWSSGIYFLMVSDGEQQWIEKISK